jgi:hypothetical protein
MHNLTAVSGLDDLLYDVTLTDASTSAPLDVAVAGTVSVSLCRLNTVTPLGGTATQVLGWQGAGRWTAVQDDTDILAALTAGGVVVGQKFDLILTIGTLGVRKLSTCQRVAILDLVP